MVVHRQNTDDIEAFLLLDNPNDAFIFHEYPFENELSWLEYDVETARLDFILQDGELRHFGIPVADHMRKYLHDMNSICVAKTDNGIVVDEQDIPLVIHGA